MIKGNKPSKPGPFPLTIDKILQFINQEQKKFSNLNTLYYRVLYHRYDVRIDCESCSSEYQANI